MAEWISTLRGALLFDTETYTRFHSGRDVFLRGVLMVVVVALVASLPAFVIDLAGSLRSRPAVTEMSEATSELERGLQQALPFLQGLPPDVRDQLLSQMRQGALTGQEIAVRIEALPTILPRPVGGGLAALGKWFSRPFGGAVLPLSVATLGTWLGYGIWVTLMAKLLGGRADLPGFFGTTSLFAGPHLLNIFGPVPILGPLMGFIAFVWGIGIYVKATAVSHELSIERALLAVLLPILILAAVLIVVVFGVATIVAISAGGR